MTDDEENAIVNASTEALMKELSTSGKPVEAVVTVVLYRGGETFHVGTRIDLDRPPGDEDEAALIEGAMLLTASDLLDTYVHEQGLCDACNQEKGAAN